MKDFQNKVAVVTGAASGIGSVLCPAWVNTRIMDSERNRPQNAPQEEPISPETVAAIRAIRQLVQTGIPPSQVAETVFDAIRQEKFYILTHPGTKQVVQMRMEDILQERVPTDSFRVIDRQTSKRQPTETPVGDE